MSASEPCAVSMMIGLRKPLRRMTLTASRPSMSGQAHIHDGEIDPVALDGLDRLAAVSAVVTWNSS